MEDGAIIELLFARSERAFDALTEKYGRSCMRLAGNLTGNAEDAEEVVNDAWLGVWNTIPPKRPQSLFGYVCKLVRNIAITKYHEKTARVLERIRDSQDSVVCVNREDVRSETLPFVYLGQEPMLVEWAMPQIVYGREIVFCDK